MIWARMGRVTDIRWGGLLSRINEAVKLLSLLQELSGILPPIFRPIEVDQERLLAEFILS
jgi:hypothetical protein